jgi:hypothetical protein
MATGMISSQGNVENLQESPTATTTSPEESALARTTTAVLPQSPPTTTRVTPQKETSPLSTTESIQSPETLLHKDSRDATKAPIVFQRTMSSFIRVADLKLDDGTIYTDEDEDLLSDDDAVPNFHTTSVDPPPGVILDPKERWVALDDGTGRHAPIAPHVVRALANVGKSYAFDQTLWTPDGKTAKVVKHNAPGWHTQTWRTDGVWDCQQCVSEDVLVWSGVFPTGFYGSDLPAVRSASVINMSPQDLVDLLLDSSRVQEYNKLSLGRIDLLTLQATMEDGPFGGITKVMRSESKPPLVRKTLQFTSICHVRKLADDSGYKIVSRAVTMPTAADQQSTSGIGAVGPVMHSEILLGVNILKRIEGAPNQTGLVTVNHIRSPMVPMMIAKRIGLQASYNFVHDLRQCC